MAPMCSYQLATGIGRGLEQHRCLAGIAALPRSSAQLNPGALAWGKARHWQAAASKHTGSTSAPRPRYLRFRAEAGPCLCGSVWAACCGAAHQLCKQICMCTRICVCRGRDAVLLGWFPWHCTCASPGPQLQVTGHRMASFHVVRNAKLRSALAKHGAARCDCHTRR